MQIRQGDVNIQLLEEDSDDDVITVVAPRERELEVLCRQVNNAFIRRLALDFRLEDLSLPYYLRANSDDLRCRVRTLYLKDTDPTGESGGRWP